jgi:hypothetical protein
MGFDDGAVATSLPRTRPPAEERGFRLQVASHQLPLPRRHPIDEVPPRGIRLSGFRGNCRGYFFADAARVFGRVSTA